MKKIILVISVFFILIPLSVSAIYKEYTINGSYFPGEIVSNSGSFYMCTENRGTNQCSFGKNYEPGVGVYWKRTWTLVDQIEIPEEEFIVEENNNSGNNNTGNNNSTDTSDVRATTFIPTKTNKSKTKKTTKPGTPSISVISKSYFDGNYALNWTIPVNSILGDTVQLYENGKLISEKSIDETSESRGGTFTIANNNSGTFKYHVVMCLREVCSSSGNMNINVGSGGSSSTNKITFIPVNTSKIKEKVDSKTLSEEKTITPKKTNTLSVNREDIPSFSSLPKGTNFDDLSIIIEKQLKADIKSGKKTKTSINSELEKIDLWIDYLSDINELGDLTGSEKRSVLILLMMKEIYNKYN